MPYDMLRTRILQQARQNGWRRVGLVSPTAGCGKTTTAANLAFAFRRQRDVRSIILDLDLRRPCLNVVLGQDARGNIGDVIEGRKDFRDLALRLGDNVALGLNDSATETSSEILQSRQAQARLAEVEAQLDPDIVLCDLPPMMATDDNFGFLSNVDCVLLMVAAEETQTAQIEATLRHLGDLTTVMGIILSKCRHVAGAYGYDDQYHYA
ncbi:Mrp family chromosome partitioning ATPase [Aliiruegeria haliotis]|uniref:Mrp family chromosome partitioning ATPase n=1 Tax=Aliiruegeria haliotis TaxID=1280846 RepID=A0A2T0RT18_9RHOB|nr:Mrp family chromosome partitioning ATPase [Aliiruegeria haliotis]